MGLGTFQAKNKNGRLYIPEHERLVEHLKTLGEDITVTVRNSNDGKQRSSNQNRYFHGPLLDALTHHFEEKFGYTKEEIKEIVKFKFLKDVVVLDTQDGGTEEVDHVRSTSSLTTKEFEEFNENIRRWASSLGCDIKEPNEN